MKVTIKAIASALLSLITIAPSNAMAQADMASFSLTRTCENCEFSSANLPLANFSSGTFTNTNFSNATLQNAEFSESSFFGVDFISADLRGADFRSAVIGRNVLGGSVNPVNFSDADLRGANFSRAHVYEFLFVGADLRGANFSSSIQIGARGNFNGAQLSSANFSGSEISRWDNAWVATFGNSGCSSDFGQMSHNNVNFSNINPGNGYSTSGFRIQGQFDEANFSNSAITFNVFGSDCELSFTNSNFNQAHIKGNLSNADLTGSSFINARVEADLSNTNLENVDFTGANLAGSNLQGARFCNTTAPDGSVMFDGC